ncbi:hypothetical protein FACS1894151_05320 [Spirochaetia bacterium]|nr:hypothetical protein FACS1894151_05320 [Spirochaetia bacterium]
MNIAFGHTNMDLDCLGSLVFIKKLFPDYVLVRSRLIHPVAQNLYYLFEEYFNFISPKDLTGEKIDNIIIVDTCSASRVQEYFSYIQNCSPKIRVFDHHVIENADILGAEIEGGKFGANTSFLGKMAMQRGITLTSEEATIALTGIYADTGRLIYENVVHDDFEVAAWLVDMGASLKLVKSFLETIKEDDQLLALNQLLLVAESRVIQGHVILFSYLELNENIPGLSAVVEKIMDIENPDAYFAVFFIPKSRTVLLIARSQKVKIDLHELLQVYGGGGHQLAASAKINNKEGKEFEAELYDYLERSLEPATRAKDIMRSDIQTIDETVSLLGASMFMEMAEVTGAPVLNAQGEVTGFLSLRDISKGRKANSMKSPVTAYMSKPVIACGSMVTMREVERIFYRYHIGQILIVEGGRLLGYVTRWDYLEYRKRKAAAPKEKKNPISGVIF